MKTHLTYNRIPYSVRRSFRVAVLVVGILTLFAVAVFVPRAFADERHAAAEPAGVAAHWTAKQSDPKLPAEWVWQKRTIGFDHMYRTQR